ncbi:MAG: LPS export ABC transporter periplasmic protein LptC [Methylovulum sp.]|jgi:LPS export ABC transporter protein LptC|nr:LPS export ABC transporter periplasmic protein LptC [Methylovulum sp.]
MILTLQEHRSFIYVAMLALLSWLLVNMFELQETHLYEAPAHSADFYSKGYVKWTMNHLGQLHEKLEVAELIHYSDDLSTKMIQPRLSIYTEDVGLALASWQITAQQAMLYKTGKELLLKDDVHIIKTDTASKTQFRIDTTNVKINTTTHYFETSEFAKLTRYPSQLTGMGMHGRLVQPMTLELLSNVKGIYETTNH